MHHRLDIPPEWSCSGKAPYDVLADTLRRTKGIMGDRFRRPEKILAAAEHFVLLMVDFCVRQGAHAESPLVIFWLHKGADGFMSEADFGTYYWPTLEALILGLVDQGLVPALFAQGSYDQRLDIIADENGEATGSVSLRQRGAPFQIVLDSLGSRRTEVALDPCGDYH